MSAFEQASKIEEMARREILPWLVRTCEKVDSTDRCLFLQKIVGDFMATKNGRDYNVELKAEEENKYGNFFLETWSNKKWRTPGWMLTSHADYLFYYFVKERELYVMKFDALTRWAFGYADDDGRVINGAIYQYPEKPQKRYDQQNDTWGRCVPINDALNGIAPKYKIITADAMLEAA